jgi:phospholipid/cholesterol/gamma-HCH transport system ATP-binding protein
VGLLFPDEGYVKIEGARVDEMTMKELYEVRKRFGFLFQGSALFDSMTVEENIALPLVESKNKYTVEELDKKIEEKLEMVGMSGVQKLKPAELSGGMKKRVGLARALITDPDFIFYDEPTTGLDPIMSDSIDELIKELTDQLNATSIVVTHDMYSVKEVAHQVAMMHEGIIHFAGSPNELLNSDDFIIREFIKRTE